MRIIVQDYKIGKFKPSRMHHSGVNKGEICLIVIKVLLQCKQKKM